MPKAYSGDLRVRVIEMVQAGASRRETAEEFSVADSTAVKWLQRWKECGSAEAKPRGGSVSPLEALFQGRITLSFAARNSVTNGCAGHSIGAAATPGT
jgi:transposase